MIQSSKVLFKLKGSILSFRLLPKADKCPESKNILNKYNKSNYCNGENRLKLLFVLILTLFRLHTEILDKPG